MEQDKLLNGYQQVLCSCGCLFPKFFKFVSLTGKREALQRGFKVENLAARKRKRDVR